jgi:hypothetical protein
MCQQMTMLAELEEHRFIARCEHGTIHLNWDVITLHLTKEYFLELAQELQEPLPQQGILMIKRSWFHLTGKAGRGYALRIGQAELHLSTQDVLFLIHMLQRSLRILQDATETRQVCLVLHPTVTTTDSRKYSQN